ncbi:hypothetical protein COCVIDRAFT_92288 [Bipolaris victoriae FI3]|uniref:EthD domain-containing protein n=2 Tax=Bipolaris TaxID=33194 RepID=W6XWG3_COCC2|nr:uncharacterized protein COCCADRAFT_40070 [Bipolaris zeicola 26-R-13]XP_014559259.1 hypothetical protein COCVIDRAFT_92288 [Bipolaris victoriae FI3]EUC29555.1 hypothetical protein COCCADRAFT_40070 [Bipolaris zeicola 26-R-13]
MPNDPVSLATLSTLPSTYDPNKPVYMLNLWKYRKEASYRPEHAHLAGDACSGQEALGRYRAAIAPLHPPNTSVIFSSTVLAKILVAENEDWDFVAILKYETLEGFKKAIGSKEYREEVEPHRLAGLEDGRLIVLDKLE